MKTKHSSNDELNDYLSGNHGKRILAIEPNNAIIYIDIDGKEVTLKELQRLVDGYIELYPTDNKYYYYIVDEEGLLKGKDLNSLAKELLGIEAVGTVVLVPKEYFY